MTPEELEDLPLQGHVRIVYLGPVAPHWEVHRVFGDPQVVDEFRLRREWRGSNCYRRTTRSSVATAGRVARDAERERLELDWDLGYPEE